MSAASALSIFKRFIKTSSLMNYITEMNGDFPVLSSFLSRVQFSSCKSVFFLSFATGSGSEGAFGR